MLKTTLAPALEILVEAALQLDRITGHLGPGDVAEIRRHVAKGILTPRDQELIAAVFDGAGLIVQGRFAPPSETEAA